MEEIDKEYEAHIKQAEFYVELGIPHGFNPSYIGDNGINYDAIKNEYPKPPIDLALSSLQNKAAILTSDIGFSELSNVDLAVIELSSINIANTEARFWPNGHRGETIRAQITAYRILE